MRPAAVADLGEAYAWYESQVPGLGESFLAEVRYKLDQIAARLDSLEPNQPPAPVQYARVAPENVANSTNIQAGVPLGSGAILKSAAYEPSAPRAPRPGERKEAAIAIALAAKRLSDLRDNRLNPKEWTDRVGYHSP